MDTAWLITGGAGFIGGNFVRTLAPSPPATLVILDALTYAGNLANIADVVDGRSIRFVHGDIRDREVVSRVFADHDIARVIHFAAESHVDRSITGPQDFVTTNVVGTLNLLSVAHERWRNFDTRARPLFLHVSTDEVFGALEPSDPPFHERTAYAPNSPYAASKAAADHLARAWHHTFGLPIVITNCSNNYGPRQFPEKLIPLTILNAIEGRELPVYGDGLQVRDWLHVGDHCEALVAVLERGVIGETYCIGGGEQRTNLDTVNAICTIVDERLGRAPGTTAQLIRHVTDRPGHDRRYAIDSTKIRTAVGWAPKRSLAASLPDIVDWYLEHPEWVETIRSGEYLRFYARQYGQRLHLETA